MEYAKLTIQKAIWLDNKTKTTVTDKKGNSNL
jgi:hypothetical protein